MTIERFRIAIDDAALADLDARLALTRWANEFANEDWRYGVQGEYLRDLVAYWRSGYDWRAQEAAMNRFDHYRTVIDDVPIHFLHVKGKGPKPIPLIMSHGWPWTFWDWQKLIGPLSDPAASGGDLADAFELIIPSMPGYAFSSPLTKRGVNGVTTADLWAKLMTRLGHERFAAHGGDWGAFVTAQLGHAWPERLIGIHMLNGAPLDAAAQPLPQKSDYAADEEGWHARTAAFFSGGFGYAAVQSTRPQTLAWALEDSPVGLCAWLLDKRRSWADCGGDVDRAFSRDDLLTSVMLYWLTGTAGSASRYYFERRNDPWRPVRPQVPGEPTVSVPTGVLRFEGDLCFWPRQRLEEHFNLQRYTRRPQGGHFAPMEQPQAVIDDLRAFYRALR